MFFFPSSAVLTVIQIVNLQREYLVLTTLKAGRTKNFMTKHIMMRQAGLSGQKNSKESSYALNNMSTFSLLIKTKP